MLNEPAEGGDVSDQAQGGGLSPAGAPPGSGIIQVTPSEKEAIERVSVQHCVPAMLITFIYMCNIDNRYLPLLIYSTFIDNV